MSIRFAVILSFLAISVPVRSSVIVPPLAQINLQLSLPRPLDEVMKSSVLGIDQEDESTRKLILRQAKAYADARASRSGTANWLSNCLLRKDSARDPFCRFEIEGRLNAGHSLSRDVHRAVKRRLASAMGEGRFEAVDRATWGEMVAAVGVLHAEDRLDNVVTKVSKSSDCQPPSVPAALAYKLEERFPEQSAVDLVESLYRKAVTCAGSAPGAARSLASFRLGLIHIWRNRCDDVSELMTKVEEDREASTYHARARYWKYHCAGQKNDDQTRRAARETMLKVSPMAFHTLAAWGVNDDPGARLLGGSSPSVAMRSIVRADLNELVRATEALIKIDAKRTAAELIDRNARAIGTMEPEVRLYVASLMNQIGHALPKFRILNDLFLDAPQSVSETTLRMYFPLWYFEEVKTAATSVDPLLIISLIRQESAFEKTARSHVGARGLMQVMPQTARSVARVRADRLFDPATNIGVGTKYFLKRLEQYDGDVELTLAAYNAGFSRVDQWRKRYPTDNKILFLDLIPFRETRDYVSSILRNYYWYVRLYGEPSSADQPRSVRSPASVAPTTGSKVMAIVSAQAGRAAMTEKK